MGMPRAVKEAGERSEQALAALQAQQQAEQDQPPQGDPPAPEGEQGDPSNPPEGADPTPPEGGGKPAKDEFRDKFFVLKGKYDAEVPRMAAQVRSLLSKTEALEAANAELRKQVESAPKAPTEPHPDEAALVREYGPTIVETIERIADRKAAERVAPLQGKVEESEAERKARQQREEADRKAADFAEAVEDLVPDWEAIDKLPAFQAYLAEPGADGRQRQAVLIEAAQKFDAAGAARIFVAFKRTPAGQAATGTKPPASKTDRLEGLRVPDTTGRDRGNGGGKKVWTKAEMTAFYKDKALGKFANDPERAKQIERDIDDAAREGRIRG